MEDYPRTLRELDEQDGTDAACREYLEQIRCPSSSFVLIVRDSSHGERVGVYGCVWAVDARPL
jgi:hypothetical protein